MKKTILFLATFIFVSLSAIAEENRVIDFKSDDFVITLKKSVGNTPAQVVKLEFLLVHSLPNQTIYFNESGSKALAYDEEGNSYDVRVTNGSGYWGNQYYMPTDQPRKISMQVESILSKVEFLSSLVFTIRTSNGRVEVTMRDIPVTWKY